jgi:hypothetical protein
MLKTQRDGTTTNQRGKRFHHIVVLPSWTTNQEESPSTILLATYLDAKNYAQVSAIFK